MPGRPGGRRRLWDRVSLSRSPRTLSIEALVGLPWPTEEPRDEDAEEVEPDHREGERRLVHHVGRRCHDRRHDEGTHDRPLPALEQEARRHETDPGEDEDDD